MAIVEVEDGITAFAFTIDDVGDLDDPESFHIRNAELHFFGSLQFAQIVEEGFDLAGRGFISNAMCGAPYCFDEKVFFDGFEEVVDRAVFEGLDGIFVMGGDENDLEADRAKFV